MLVWQEQLSLQPPFSVSRVTELHRGAPIVWTGGAALVVVLVDVVELVVVDVVVLVVEVLVLVDVEHAFLSR